MLTCIMYYQSSQFIWCATKENKQSKYQHYPSDFGCEYAAEKGCVCLDSKNGGEIYFIWFWIFRRNAVFCWGLLLKTKHKRRKNENKMSATEKQKQYQVSEDGGVWTIKTSTTLKTMELKFKVFIFIFLHQFTSISIMPRNVGHA